MARGSLAGESRTNQQAPQHPTQSLLVQAYAWRELMAAFGIQSTAVASGSDCEAWPYLDEDVLRPRRSRKVCMTCQLQHGLIAQGEHLIRRCQGWTDDMVRQKGWAPEVS